MNLLRTVHAGLYYTSSILRSRYLVVVLHQSSCLFGRTRRGNGAAAQAAHVSRLSLERTPVRPQSAARLFFSLVAVAPQRIAHLPNV
jgi:hypothetical protein